MNKHIRTTLIATTVAYAGVVAGIAQQGGRGPGFGPPGPPPKLTKIKDNIYVVENQAAKLSDLAVYGGNATIYLTEKGVVLVDSKFERVHDDIRSKIQSLTNQPVKYLILTHNHGDHSGGAAKFEAEGAQVIISTRDRENLAKTPNQTWLPSFTYAGSATLYMDGKEIDLRQMRGHTSGDTVVYFPAERVVCAGDLVTLPWDDIPLIVNYGDGGNWTDWNHSIEELLKMEWDFLIPGHGPAIDKAQLRDLHNRMVRVIDRFRALLREGKNQQEITQTLVKEFNWGAGPAAGVIPGMMTELR
jgi:glyoxylase-like metal-dependent hydrolase (beta-lactamase superfamily II)